MYIAPDSTIKILHNVPLDKTYEHTIHFVTQEAQLEYFNSKVKYTLTDYTYQRMERDYIRVAKKTEDLYDCNYVMYQNSAFGNKWFFAFLDQPNYINNEVCELQITIDVMQTWRFDYILEPCFVERMTPKRDFIGDNIVPEPAELGELVYNIQNEDDKYKIYPTGSQLDLHHVAILAVCDVENQSSGGNMYDGIYGGATLYAYDVTETPGSPNSDFQLLNEKIFSYVQKPDAILAIYYAPSWLIGNVIPSDHKLAVGVLSQKKEISLAHPSADWTLDGYLPNNCKMYTYPYNFFNFDNGQGDAMALRYEFFKDLTPKLFLSGCISQPVSLLLKPFNYKMIPLSVAGSKHTLYNAETLELTNYPMCSWNTDAYMAWVAQNAVPIAKKVGSSLAITVGEAMTGHIGLAAMGAASLISEVKSALLSNYKASIAADIAKGNFNSGSPAMAQGQMYFHGGRMSVNYQYARMIDRFFDRYGYAQNRIMTPERHNRPRWTYIKTAGCDIHGQMPQDDLKKICNVYDNGCLFFTPESDCIFAGDNRPVANSRGYNPAYVRNGYNPD